MDVSSESPDLCLLGFTLVRRHLFPINNDQGKGLPFAFFRGELLRDSEEMTLVSQRKKAGGSSLCFSTSVLCSPQTLRNLSLLSFSFSESDSSLEIFHSTSSLDLSLRDCFSFCCQFAAGPFLICKFLG